MSKWEIKINTDNVLKIIMPGSSTSNYYEIVFKNGKHYPKEFKTFDKPANFVEIGNLLVNLDAITHIEEKEDEIVVGLMDKSYISAASPASLFFEGTQGQTDKSRISALEMQGNAEAVKRYNDLKELFDSMQNWVSV